MIERQSPDMVHGWMSFHHIASETMAKDPKKKSCFVVGQIGSDDSPERIHSDWVFDEIVSPVFAPMGDFRVVRADKVATPGLIDTQIISELLNSDLVIADLTGLNPNAFYEIGIRHVVQKPIIHMHLAGQTIPFDISLFRSLKFSTRRPADIRGARIELAEMVEMVLADDYQVENPVTNARGRIRFDETATPSDRVLREEIEALKARVGSLEAPAYRPVASAPLVTTEFVERGVASSSEEDVHYSVGERVFHLKFGYGRIELVDKNKLSIDFEKVGRKKVLDAFVTRGA